MTKSKGKDPLEGLGGPMTRARARKAKEALQQVLSILFEYKPKFQGKKFKVVSCIMPKWRRTKWCHFRLNFRVFSVSWLIRITFV